MKRFIKKAIIYIAMIVFIFIAIRLVMWYITDVYTPQATEAIVGD